MISEKQNKENTADLRRTMLRRRFLALSVSLLISIIIAWKTNHYAGLGTLIILLVGGRNLLKIHWDPLTRKKFQRFRQLQRGFLSFTLLGAIWFLSLFAELIINDRPIAIYYEGKISFPTYGRVVLESEFGIEGPKGFEPVKYRQLDERFEEEDAGNWVLMPLVPYNPNENNTFEGVLKPRSPDWTDQHFLGTDQTGRDILARLVYGFRIAIFFAMAFMILTYLIGIGLGCLMGYLGGTFDLLFQRIIEIWSNIPFIYTVIIVFSVIPTGFEAGTRIIVLLIIMVLFSWTGMTYYMRTATLKERARDYTSAAIVMGASSTRVIFNHILPNTISTLVTFIPFTISGAIAAITALDFLGYGLPPPTPSIGELLKQGRDNVANAPWIITSAFCALTILLVLVTFIGEAIRDAFDPKKYTRYI
jgi:microcin C transport system permease protein